jgi:hypothetical protein
MKYGETVGNLYISCTYSFAIHFHFRAIDLLIAL